MTSQNFEKVTIDDKNILYSKKAKKNRPPVKLLF